MINISTSSILFDFGPVQIHYYGVIFVFAVICSMFIINKYAKKNSDYNLMYIDNLYFYLLIFGIIGARLYSVFFFDFDYYKDNLIDIFKIWNGGIAIQGALISGFLTIYFYCKKNKLSTLKYLDIFALIMPLAQSIGRWGNFFNSELYGKVSNLPWAIYIKNTGDYRQPLFFYESILDLILFFILLRIFNSSKIQKSFDGKIIALYILGYGIIRFFMEFLRIDNASMIFNIRLPQIISLIFIILSSIFLICRRRQNKC